MSEQAPLSERAEALVQGTAGITGWTCPAGHFRVEKRHLERVELSSLERAVEVSFRPSRPLGGYNNPLDGRDLRTRELVVRVGYVLTPQAGTGEVFEVQGGESGPSDLSSVEDRGETDAATLRTVLGYPANWSLLTPTVIDCAPSPDGDPDPIELPDRVIREVHFIVLTCGVIPETYRPTT